MDNLYRVEDMVKVILKEDETTRNSDTRLYYEFCRRYRPDVLSDGFGGVLQNFNDYGLPRFASVSRARRKLQAKFPELGGAKQVKRWRDANEVAVRAYANMEVRG
jgi:hypothetical protein